MFIHFLAYNPIVQILSQKYQTLSNTTSEQNQLTTDSRNWGARAKLRRTGFLNLFEVVQRIILII